MKLYNNTNNQVFYSINSPGTADCGNIAAGGTTDLPYYDKQATVNVAFEVQSTTINPSPPFSVTIPQTGTGMAVTIGIYVE